MNIYSKRRYVIAQVPGISGFQRWDEREFRVVSGVTARRCRSEVVAEWTPQADEEYALEDGHVPECQPIAALREAFAWMDDSPYNTLRPVGRAHERIAGRYAALVAHAR